MIIGFVCEGISDVPVLQAVVDAIVGPDYEPRFIQPEADALGATAGWTEVKKWCESYGPSLGDYLTWTGIDLLVVHLDADVCAKVKMASTVALCEATKRWLGRAGQDPRILIVIPSQASEAWLYAAHVATSPHIETERDPAGKLAQAGLLERDPRGEPVKDPRRYQELASRLPARLAELRKVLPELERFAGKLERVAARRSGAGAPPARGRVDADGTAVVEPPAPPPRRGRNKR